MKVIIHEEDDLLFAESMAKEANANRLLNKPLLYLQAGWDNEKGQKLAFTHVRSNPEWRLSVQSHKWLGIL